MSAPLILRGNRPFGGKKGFGDAIAAGDAGINWGKGMTGFLRSDRRPVPPLVPMGEPRRESILLVIDSIVDLPIKGEEPFEFHGVQLTHGEIADLGPGLVLESVIVQKLASQKQGHREHAVDLTTAAGVNLGGRQHAHPTSKVEQAQEDGGAREARRGQNLKDVFPEVGRDRRSWVDASRQVNIC